MAKSDLAEKAFDTAVDVTKQLITLCTAILGLTLTFSKDIIDPTSGHGRYLTFAWALYLLSILMGIFAILALTGRANLAVGKSDEREQMQALNIYRGVVPYFSGSQILLFLAGSALMIWVGSSSLGAPKKVEGDVSSSPTSATVSGAGSVDASRIAVRSWMVFGDKTD